MDLLTRALSARAVSGAAAALGLLLLGGLGILSAGPLMSRVCTSVNDCHYLYRWHDHYGIFQDRRRAYGGRGHPGLLVQSPTPCESRTVADSGAGVRMRVIVDTTSPVPAYEQIRAQVTALADNGVLPAGTRLPPIRQLAADLGLAPGTVAKAYALLEKAGVASTHRRRGTLITDRGVLDPNQQLRELRRAAAAFSPPFGSSISTGPPPKKRSTKPWATPSTHSRMRSSSDPYRPWASADTRRYDAPPAPASDGQGSRHTRARMRRFRAFVRRPVGCRFDQGMWGRGQLWPLALSIRAARSTWAVKGKTSAIAFTTVVSLAPWARVATETCGTHCPAA